MVDQRAPGPRAASIGPGAPADFRAAAACCDGDLTASLGDFARATGRPLLDSRCARVDFPLAALRPYLPARPAPGGALEAVVLGAWHAVLDVPISGESCSCAAGACEG